MVYSIRSLKNGTGSVLIGASFILLALTAPSVSAAETSLGTQKNVSAISANPATTETSQAEEKTPICPKDANASLESKTSEPVAVSETTTTEATPSLPNNKDEKTEVSSLAAEKASLADTVSETPIEDKLLPYPTSKNFLKKTKIRKVFGLGMMLKNHLRTGQMAPSPSRMPRKTTTATT